MDDTVNNVLKDCNQEQQDIVKHAWLKKPNQKSLIDCVQREKEAVEVTAFNNIKEVLDKAKTIYRTNDSRSFQKTLITAMAPAQAGKCCHELGEKLGCKKSTFRSKIRTSIQARKQMLQEDGQLMQMHKRKCNARCTPGHIADLQHHILNNCTDLVKRQGSTSSCCSNPTASNLCLRC